MRLTRSLTSATTFTLFLIIVYSLFGILQSQATYRSANQSIGNNDVIRLQHHKSPLYYDSHSTNIDEDGEFPSKQIPAELLRRLKEITSMDELFETLIEPTHPYRLRSLKSTNELSPKRKLRKNRKTLKSRASNVTITNTEEDEDNSDDTPLEFGPIFDKRAFCHPRRQPVNIPQPKDPTLIYQPMCIQIERCGGCCAHELFHCVPSDKRNASRKVVVLRYPHSGAEYFVFETVAKVKIERHTKCQCQCKIQPEDCSSQQVYDRENCRCNCAQQEGHLKCKTPQIWVEKECRCRCPDYTECSTGTYFDTRMCRCRGAGEILTYNKLVRSHLTKSRFH